MGAVAETGQVAVRAAVEAFEEEPEPEQLGLFAPAETDAGKLKEREGSRGPGRPAGAKNKRTERTTAFLMQRHRDPREVLLEIAEANLKDLAGLLGCSLHEALQEKRLAAIGVLPYVAQKLPLAVDVTTWKGIRLVIDDGAGDPATDGVGVTAQVLNNVVYEELETDE